MSDLYDRFTLALGVLDGEKDAHRILADMLEDQGDRGLAQWARARKGRRGKRLDFVLAVLPYKTSLRLGCDFLDHAIKTKKGRRKRAFKQTSFEIYEISKWVVSPTEDAHISQFLNSPSPEYAEELRLALRFAVQADELERNSEFPQSRARASESRTAVRRVARQSREIAAAIANRSRRSWVTQESSEELDWQISHTHRVVSELLQHV